MTTNDHLSKAKAFIAKGEDYYRKAAVEMAALVDEGWTFSAIGREVGKSRDWVRDIVAWASNRDDHRPFGGPDQDKAQSKSRAKKFLRDAEPEAIREIVSSLPGAQVERLIEEAHGVAVERVGAKRAEHDDSRRVKDLMPKGEAFNPSEFWADTLIVRVSKVARELESLTRRAGGLLYGSMTPEQAYEYLSEAEGLIAEARAAAQEQVRDQVTA